MRLAGVLLTVGLLASPALAQDTNDTSDTGTPTTPTTPTDTGSPTTPTTPTDTGSPTTPTDTGTTGTTGTTDPNADLDLDGDGWTPAQGDCDDNNALANPGLVEECFDRIDNDCNGLFDEGEECDIRVQQATLRGGGGCTGGSGVGGTNWLLLPLLGLGLWRRSRR
jgi:hypothetical protein